MPRAKTIFSLTGWLLCFALAMFIIFTDRAPAGLSLLGPTCVEDIAPPGGDGVVNVDDLLAVINAWGVCDVDADGDGWTVGEGDCNDDNPNIYPGATEVCNGVDDDCDDAIDEGCKVDGDGDGWTVGQGDCDDTNPNIYPGAPEVCNQTDDDCDGMTDEGLPLETPEPPNVCAAAHNLGNVLSSAGTYTYNGFKVYPAGDSDWFRFTAIDDTSGGCFPGSNENFNLQVRLTVPAAASGPYSVTVRIGQCGGPSFSHQIPPGSSQVVIVPLTGVCGTQDTWQVYVTVQGVNPQAWSCVPYTLQATLTEM